MLSAPSSSRTATGSGRQGSEKAPPWWRCQLRVVCISPWPRKRFLHDLEQADDKGASPPSPWTCCAASIACGKCLGREAGAVSWGPPGSTDAVLVNPYSCSWMGRRCYPGVFQLRKQAQRDGMSYPSHTARKWAELGVHPDRCVPSLCP